MLTINLLPKERKENYRYREVNRMIILVCFLVLAVLALAVLGAVSLKAMVNAQKNSAEQNLAQKKTQLDLLSSDKTRIEQLNNSMAEIKKLMQSQTDWNKVLQEIASKTPVDVQLSKLSLGSASKEANPAPDAAGGTQINLGGQAASRRSVMKFKDQLERTGNFQNLTFNSLDETPNDKGAVTVTFDLTGGFTQTSSTAKTTKE